MFLSDSRRAYDYETLDFAFYIGSTPTFLYFDLYFNTAYAAHYVYFPMRKGRSRLRDQQKRENVSGTLTLKLYLPAVFWWR